MIVATSLSLNLASEVGTMYFCLFMPPSIGYFVIEPEQNLTAQIYQDIFLKNIWQAHCVLFCSADSFIF